MKRTTLLSLTTAAALAGLLAATPVHAGEGKHHAKNAAPKADATAKSSETKPERPMQWLHDTLVSLNLGDDQKTKIKALAEDARKQMEAWRTAHQGELDSFKQELEAARNAKDKAKLSELREKGKTLWSTAPKLTELLDKIDAVLTPEQKSKFDAAVQQKKSEAKGRFFDRAEGGAKGGKAGDDQLNL